MALTSATESTALSSNTAVATFSDTDASDVAGDFTATIDWGDGVTTTGTVVGSNGSFTVDGGHTYADEGSDAATVTLTHNPDGAHATASGSVAVAEDDVLTAHNATIKVKANETFSAAVATFSDTDRANVAGDFAATIDWGDGTTSAGTVSGSNGSFTVSGSHAYAHPGNEDVTVTLSDDAPGSARSVAHSDANVSSDGRGKDPAPQSELGAGGAPLSLWGGAGLLLLNQFAAAGFGSGGGSPPIDTGPPSPITQALASETSTLTSPTAHPHGN